MYMRLVTCLAAVAALWLLGGCVNFTEPLPDDPSLPIDLSTFLGPWRSEETPGLILDLEPSSSRPNTLLASFRSVDEGPSDLSAPATVQVSQIEGQIVISVSSNTAGGRPMFWSVAAVEVGENASAVTIRWLDDQTVLAAIRSGALKGRQADRESSRQSMAGTLIEVSGAALRDYLTEHVEALSRGEETRLLRADPEDIAMSSNRSLLPTAVNAGSGSDGPTVEPWTAMADVNPAESNASGWDYPYPDMPGFPATSPTDLGGQPANAVDGSGSSGGASPSTSPDADTPNSLNGVVLALVLLVVLGLVGGVAFNYFRRYQSDGRREDGEANALGDASLADDDEPRPSGLVAQLRGYALPALLILAVALGPILYVAVLLNGLSFSASTLGLQPGAWGMLRGFAPYLIVLSIGCVIAIAEVVTTFPAFAAEALSTRWAAILVLFYGLGGMTVYSVVMNYASSFDHPLIRALLIAVGFAVLIRTRFVLARDLRGPVASNDTGGAARDGVSMDVGWLYARIQQLCLQRIESDLLRNPRYAIARLLALFPDAVSLQRAATDSIKVDDLARAADQRARLAALAAQDVAPRLTRARLARFIVETGGITYTRFLLEHGT